jgi:F-type H+-transporting ATPase subunit delta
MKVSRESRRQAREFFRLACAGGSFSDDAARQIADMLCERRPRGFFGTLKEFTRLVRLEREKHRVRVDSASALDPTERGALEESLRARFGGDLTTEFHEDPALIAGMRVQVGSDVWDGSVRARLETLKASI